jgi:LAO/AO transport system kinase
MATSRTAVSAAGDPREALVDRFRRGDQRALARAISLAEEGSPAGQAVLRALFRQSGNALVYGITGAPGAGKSTLVEQLALAFRARGLRVAIVAVDPSSPFTGGAVLGDRVRMGRALADGDVYMRSLANRGHLGGLSLAAEDVITLLDAFGFDVILVETVGTGQAEVEIMHIADATLVVVVPGLGDYVQAMKAGILEIADLYVVNKADREGAERTVTELKGMLDATHMGRPGLNRWTDDDGEKPPSPPRPAIRRPHAGAHLVERFGSASPGAISWVPPVVKTVATEGTGVDAVADALESHDTFVRESGRKARHDRSRAETRLRQAVSVVAARAVMSVAETSGALARAISAVAERDVDPYSAAEDLLGLRE